MPSKLIVCDHPLVQEKLAFMRDKRASYEDFRRHMEQIGALMEIGRAHV